MASDELASKLTRRLQIEDGTEDAVAVDLDHEAEENGDDEKSTTDNAGTELGAKLQRREQLNEGVGQHQQPSAKVYNPNTEFKEFSRKQIKDMEKMFKQTIWEVVLGNCLEKDRHFQKILGSYDAGKDGFIDLMELKLMMEKLEAPQTHLGLKNMIKEVDEDLDNKLSFREFLLIFRKAAAGELLEGSGLQVLAILSEIDVSSEGVKGAKSFFDAKVKAISDSNRFEEEIRQEQEEKKKELEEKKQRKAAFKELKSAFK